MKLLKDIRGETAVLTLKGDFDSFVCNPFAEQIEGLLEEGVLHIVLNMQNVKFINSTGAGCILKNRRKLKEKDGDLVLSAPSPFVRNVLESLGLTEVLTLFEDDEAALAHFNAGDGIEMSSGNNVMIHSLGDGGTPLVGRIRILEEKGIVFEIDDRETAIKAGSEVRLKFRLPLYRKSHYFDIIAEITEIIHSDTGIRFTTHFTHIFDDDRASISQFVKDIQFLRREARGT